MPAVVSAPPSLVVLDVVMSERDDVDVHPGQEGELTKLTIEIGGICRLPDAHARPPAGESPNPHKRALGAKASGSTVMNLNLHYNPPVEMKRLSRLSFYFELQNLQNRTYVASASNVSDTINSMTGQQNGAASIAAATGSIYAGMPRTSYGGVKIHF